MAPTRPARPIRNSPFLRLMQGGRPTQGTMNARARLGTGKPITTPNPAQRWLTRQRVQEIRSARTTRSPSASAIKDLLRLSQDRDGFPQPAQVDPRMPAMRRRMARKPLPRQMRVLQPAVLVGNAFISRGELQRLEEIVVTQGLPNAIAMTAIRHPFLAEVLQNRAAFQEFVTKYVPSGWRKRLLAFLDTRNPELMAVGLLLYLRKAHRNPREIAQRMTQSTMRRLQAPKAA